MEAPPSNSVKQACMPSQFPGDADTASITTLKNMALNADHLSVLGGKEVRLWDGLSSVTEHCNVPRACCSHRAREPEKYSGFGDRLPGFESW